MRRLIILSLLVYLPLHAQIKTENVEYKEGNTILNGFIAYKESAKKMPAVLIVHEWWGLNDYPKMRARQLAELGYLAFAVDMYGGGKVASSSEEAAKLSGAVRSDLSMLRARINAALNFIKQDPRVDAGNIAAMGYCFGGGVVLELARSGADVKGVISFHGGLATPNPTDTKVVKAKILICHGADDKFVSEKDIKSFQDEMNNLKVDWQMNYYSGAVHSFTNPNSGNNAASGIAYNENADKRSFGAMKQFFNELFK